MKIPEDKLKESMAGLEGWSISDNAIRKEFSFKNFSHAFQVMTGVAIQAEKMDHHPDWSNVYNRLTVSLSTHSEGGITEKDIELACRIDEIAKNFPS